MTDWRWYEENAERIEHFLRAMARRYGMGPDGVDALRSECVSRLPEILENWTESGGAGRSTHVFSCFKWIAHKLAKNASAGRWGIIHSNPDAAKRRRFRPMEAAAATPADEPGPEEAASEADEVQSVLGELDSFSQALVHLRYTCDQTYEEIGDYLGISPGNARVHVLRAIAEAKAAADRSDAGASDECLELIAELRRRLR